MRSGEFVECLGQAGNVGRGILDSQPFMDSHDVLGLLDRARIVAFAVHATAPAIGIAFRRIARGARDLEARPGARGAARCLAPYDGARRRVRTLRG
jgi:hypothetical protein